MTLKRKATRTSASSSSRLSRGEASASQPMHEAPITLTPEDRRASIAQAVQRRKLVFERHFEPREDLSFWRTCQALQFSKLLEERGKINQDLVFEYYIDREFRNTDLPVVRSIEVPITPQIIRDFYALPAPVEPCAYQAYKNHEFRLSDDTIARALCLPGENPWETPRQKTYLRRPSLSPSGRCWMYFVLGNICPNSHLSTIRPEIAVLMCLLAQGRYVDIASIIAHHLTTASQDPYPNRPIVFPHLVSDLCLRLQIPSRSSDKMISQMDPVHYKRIGVPNAAETTCAAEVHEHDDAEMDADVPSLRDQVSGLAAVVTNMECVQMETLRRVDYLIQLSQTLCTHHGIPFPPLPPAEDADLPPAAT